MLVDISICTRSYLIASESSIVLDLAPKEGLSIIALTGLSIIALVGLSTIEPDMGNSIISVRQNSTTRCNYKMVESTVKCSGLMLSSLKSMFIRNLYKGGCFTRFWGYSYF